MQGEDLEAKRLLDKLDGTEVTGSSRQRPAKAFCDEIDGILIAA